MSAHPVIDHKLYWTKFGKVLILPGLCQTKSKMHILQAQNGLHHGQPSIQITETLSKVTPSNVLCCPTNSPNAKDNTLTVT